MAGMAPEYVNTCRCVRMAVFSFTPFADDSSAPALGPAAVTIAGNDCHTLLLCNPYAYAEMLIRKVVMSIS